MRTRTKLTLLVAAIGLLLPTAGAGRPDPVDIALGRRIADVKFESTPFSDALDFLRDAGGINLRVDWKALEAAGIDKTVPVTFRLRNAPARKVLDTLLREAGAGNTLAYEVDDGLLEISTQEEMDKRLVTEVYDIRDLLFKPLDAGDPPEIEFQLEPVTRGGGGGSGSTLFGNSGGGAGEQNNTTPEAKGEEIAAIIRALIRPEIWDTNGGPASIRFFNGTLIVSAPRSVQELIGPSIKN